MPILRGYFLRGFCIYKIMDKLKKEYLEGLRFKDINNDKIQNLLYSNTVIDFNNNKIKQKVISNNKNLIGRFAICETEKNKGIKAECSFLMIGDNLEITPCFTNGKKRIKHVISYKWEVSNG